MSSRSTSDTGKIAVNTRRPRSYEHSHAHPNHQFYSPGASTLLDLRRTCRAIHTESDGIFFRANKFHIQETTPGFPEHTVEQFLQATRQQPVTKHEPLRIEIDISTYYRTVYSQPTGHFIRSAAYSFDHTQLPGLSRYALQAPGVALSARCSLHWHEPVYAVVDLSGPAAPRLHEPTRFLTEEVEEEPERTLEEWAKGLGYDI